ncbi:MAG: bifunctional metallophosphatase/5'-nucleotidase [Candidatus Gastranaerophilaceae bacterium]
MRKKLQWFLTLAICFSCFAALSPQAKADTTKQFEVLSTTDMHGRATSYDVASNKVDNNNLCRVSTIVKQERKKFKNNVLLIDNGDLIQGTLLAQYAITTKKDFENPMITAIKSMKYDVWVMGNHEFNYNPEQRDSQIKRALKSGIAVLGANIVVKSEGKNIHDCVVGKGTSFYDPYYIKTFNFGHNRNLRVAVIGLGNAANETWDKSSNYPNLQFSSFDNPEGLLENEIDKWGKYIKDNNLADIIIVSAHSGKGTDDGVVTDKFLLESQAVSGAEKSHYADLLIYGHDHQANIEKLKNADGKDIYIVNGGGTTVTKNIFTVTFDKNGKYKSYKVTAEARKLADVKDDKNLVKKVNKWFYDTRAWASAPLGTLDKGWSKITKQVKGKTNKDLLLSQTEFMNLINKVQLWSSWQNMKKSGEKGAVVSLASPVAATNKDGIITFVPQDGDSISILQLSMLYRFGNNTLCVVDMTPKQLYSWMNTVANKFTVENGKATLKPSEAVHGTDTFFGIDYTFDITKPEGKRVVSAKINGQNLTDMKTPIRVVLNNYRLAGSHGFKQATGLSEKDCIWQSTDYLSDEDASVQSILGQYFKAKGKVTPFDTIENVDNSKWEIKP